MHVHTPQLGSFNEQDIWPRQGGCGSLQGCIRDLHAQGWGRTPLKVDILEWGEAMSDRLPPLYPHAWRSLTIPHRVRTDKPYSMTLGTHEAYASFCLNGVRVVPGP